MEIILMLFVLINAVLGDKLGRGYLPPPGAHLSGRDLNYSDLPFQLPNDSPDSEFKSTPEMKTTSFMDSVEKDAKNFDTNFDTTTKELYISTTTQPIANYSSTSTQTTTITDFANGLKDIKLNIPQLVSNQYSSNKIPTKMESNSTKSEKMRNGINNEYSSSKNSMPVTKIIQSKDFLNMDSMSLNNVLNTESDIFNNESKFNTNLPKLNESSLLPQSKSQIKNKDNSAITTNEKNNLAPDQFSYSFDTSNGLHSEVIGTGKDGIRSKGTYSYTGDDGKLYMMEYTADENGFKPKGAHLPTPPPIPREIQKVIEQAHKDKLAGIFDDGSYNAEKYGHRNNMPVFKSKVLPENKIYIENKGTDKSPNFFEEEGSDDDSNINIPVVKQIIPVQVNYQGYDYIQTKNIPQSSTRMLPNKTDTYIDAKFVKYDMNKRPDENVHKIPNSEAKLNIVEKSNIFDSLTYTKSISKTDEPEGDYTTSTPGFPSTYNTNYNNLDVKPYEIKTLNMDTLSKSNSMITTRKPLLYYDKFNKEVVDMPDVNREIMSTMNPIYVTTDIPRSENIYVQEQVYGEDFSGPKQKPTYKSNSGYYY